MPATHQWPSAEPGLTSQAEKAKTIVLHAAPVRIGGGRIVINTWSRMRSRWIASIHENKRQHYIYHNQLLFLNKIIKPKYANKLKQSGPKVSKKLKMEAAAIKKRLNESVDSEERTKEVQKNNDLDNTIISLVTKQLRDANAPKRTEPEDRNLTFFRSLLPSLSLLDDEQTLEFHSSVINLLQTVKKRKNKSYEHSQIQSTSTPSCKQENYYLSVTSPSASTSTRSQDSDF